MKPDILPIVPVLFLCFFSCPLFAERPERDLYSDTWTATDDLGRVLPDAAQTGPPKKDKYIGMFYFLWNGRHGEQGPFDVTKTMTLDPDAIQKADSPLWGPEGIYHHWAEPIFGYYVGDDPAVLRKHAQMLADAGVDAIIFDVTNQLTYPESYQPLCRVFLDMRRSGNRVPQIAFLTPFWQPKRVVDRLWDDLYSKEEFSELWFRWKGKPLILADPGLIGAPESDRYVFQPKVPVEAVRGKTLGQSFRSDKPVRELAVPAPTWQTVGSAALLSVYRGVPGAEDNPVCTKRFDSVVDNGFLSLVPAEPPPVGEYYVELELLHGRVGWWSVGQNDRIPGGRAFLDRKPVEGTRSLRLLTEPKKSRTEQILDFFSFRKPQPDYFVGPTGPDQWGWLEVYPQHGFYTSGNEPVSDKPARVEQVVVGTAQNALDGKLAVLSHPRAHGRSFHDGRQPAPEDCDYSGRNFAEQWKRAFELDPEFVFITGWNEWIMMRFPRKTPFHGSEEQAVNFVDQFDREFSRDIEPMKGGHGDAFYYQMIAYNRRFKGTRSVPPVRSKPVTVDGNFDDWKEVGPEFRDTIGDPVKRDYRGWAKDSRYVNKTGLNDLVAAKISVDEPNQSLFFHVRTAEPIAEFGKPNRMLLFLDLDANGSTGWLGYDYLVRAGKLLRNIGGEYRWEEVGPIKGAVRDREYELAIPFELLKCQTTPGTILFKWADGILGTGQWSDFTVNGDAAPNDRYNYKAVLRTE